jgi:DNA-binding transcriptional regulator YbjK
MKAKPTDEHREQIGDAAIQILASKGVTGVSPRAVDRQGGFPPGTTAAYFRTRKALVQAAAQRLIFLDALDASGLRASAAGFATLVERALASERRDRLVARLELFLFAARSPEFVTMRWARELFVAGAEAHLRLAPVRSPQLAAIGVVALIEGLSMHGLVDQKLRRRDLVELLRSMMQGLFETPQGGPERL